MPNPFALLLLPPLLIVSLYNLLLWFNLFALQQLTFWRRIAVVSAISHAFFMIGVFWVLYLDFNSTVNLLGANIQFESFLLNNGQFWQGLFVFDTLATITITGILVILNYAGLEGGFALPITAGIVILLGTFQWYWVGGILAVMLERIWSGLRTQDEDTPDWF